MPSNSPSMFVVGRRRARAGVCLLVLALAAGDQWLAPLEAEAARRFAPIFATRHGRAARATKVN